MSKANYYFKGILKLDTEEKVIDIFLTAKSAKKLELEIIFTAMTFADENDYSLPIDYKFDFSDFFDDKSIIEKKYVYIEYVDSNIFRDKEAFKNTWDYWMTYLGRFGV